MPVSVGFVQLCVIVLMLRITLSHISHHGVCKTAPLILVFCMSRHSKSTRLSSLEDC